MTKRAGLTNLQWGIVVVWGMVNVLGIQQPVGTAEWFGGVVGVFIGSFLLVFLLAKLYEFARGKIGDFRSTDA